MYFTSVLTFFLIFVENKIYSLYQYSLHVRTKGLIKIMTNSTLIKATDSRPSVTLDTLPSEEKYSPIGFVTYHNKLLFHKN